MANFILSSDSCCDEFKSSLKERHIECLAMSYLIDEPVYDDYDSDTQYRDFYSVMRNGALPTTSQPNLAECLEFFERLTTENPGKDVVHLTLSSGLSSTCDVTKRAASEINEKLTGCKIHVVDSLGATQTQKCLLDIAEQCRNNNQSAEDTVFHLKNQRLHQQVFILANDLHHLHRGGRVSKFASVVGTVLQVKPIIVFNQKGELVVVDKVKGLTKALMYMVKMLGKHGKDIQNQTLYIAHADAPDLAQSLKEMILEEYPEIHINIGWIGPVIGAHTGPGALGLIFFGEERPTKSK